MEGYQPASEPRQPLKQREAMHHEGRERVYMSLRCPRLSLEEGRYASQGRANGSMAKRR
jgi:hypothetical protein